MRCKLRPKLHCAGCTQTRMHMLTHNTCSLSSIRGRKPGQWTPRLCHALTYLLVFICWVPQITLTLPQVHKRGHFLRSERLKTFTPSAMCCCPSFFLFHRRALGFNQSDARFIKLDEQFPEHVERSVMDPEHSFVAVRQTVRTRVAK